MEELSIGQAASRAGVHIETLRYYERRGLLARPPRSASNYRIYTGETVRRVRFIRRAQELGFTLKEIKELLSLRARPQARCADVLERTEAKITEIDEKIRTLRAIRRALVRLKGECRGGMPISACPILESLDADLDEPPGGGRSATSRQVRRPRGETGTGNGDAR